MKAKNNEQEIQHEAETRNDRSVPYLKKADLYTDGTPFRVLSISSEFPGKYGFVKVVKIAIGEEEFKFSISPGSALDNEAVLDHEYYDEIVLKKIDTKDGKFEYFIYSKA